MTSGAGRGFLSTTILLLYPVISRSPSHSSSLHARSSPSLMTTWRVGLYSRLCASWPGWAPGLRFFVPSLAAASASSLFLASPSLFLSALFFTPGAEGPSW